MLCKCFADSHLMEIAVKLILLILSKLPLEIITNDYLSELSVIVSLWFLWPFNIFQCLFHVSVINFVV